ncbi:Major facilitator superfamily MFS_1 [Burkholderiales bacterium]|nr:Major facilitator superfamily MFS_1 [Burkholderiales bacterium]
MRPLHPVRKHDSPGLDRSAAPQVAAAEVQAPVASAAPADSNRSPRSVSTTRFLQVFSAVMLPMFLAVVDQTLLATATPSIAVELGGLRDTTWIALGYMIAMTVTAPLYGRLGDRYGRRDMLLLAVTLFASGSLACGLAPNLGLLVTARVVQGLGGGGLVVLSQALVGELVPPRERARFQGYFATNYSLASIGGPIIGGLVVHHWSWRWLFLANVPLCLMAAWRVRTLPQMHNLDVRPFADALGAVLFSTAAGVTLAWVSFAGHRFDWLSAPSLTMVLAAAALWWALFDREARHAEPFLPVELLRDPAIARMALTVICFGASMFAVVFFLPIFLQLGQGTSVSESGLLLLPVTIGIVVGATVTGRIIARVGRTFAMPVAGLGIASAALALLALLPLQRPVLTALGFLCGTGLGTVMPTAQIVVQWLAGRERLGAAAAVVTLSRATGAALGTAVFGAVVFALLPGIDLNAMNFAAKGAAAGNAASSTAAAVQYAFRVGFACTAAVALLGAVTASRIRRIHL